MVPVFGFSSLQFNSYVDFSHKINSNEEMARDENSMEEIWNWRTSSYWVSVEKSVAYLKAKTMQLL